MIDSHCHLNFESIRNNFVNIINNAKKSNITSILSINTKPDQFDEHYNLIKDYNSIYLSYGLHPEHVTNTKLISKDLISKYSKINKVIGIGETGLDLYHSTQYKKEQYKVFEEHIEASIETNLPLIIHQRNSENEIMETLNDYQKTNNLRVVFHCFTGTAKLKNFCLDRNYFLSLSGIVTFKNANELRDTIKDVPISSILIETDSPFLSPVPLRGKVNEPSNVRFTAEYLSDFFQIPLSKIVKNTDDNFYNLFTKAVKYNEIYK